MGEAQELPADINDLKAEVKNPPKNADIINKTYSSFPCLRQYKWWLQMIIYVFFVLAGQSFGTLLGRSYLDNGGKSIWMATLVQVVGFPILFPFQLITKDQNKINTKQPRPILALFYIVIGIFLAADCMLYSIGFQYLPVTALICASQLGFNAVFSYFLVSKQNFTPYIANALGLLTISSLLLVFQTDQSGDSNEISEKKCVTISFLFTLAASAGYALMLSHAQVAFRKIVKKQTLRAIIDTTIYQNSIATLVVVIGLFVSGDWKKLDREMKEYKLGQKSYVVNLLWAAVSWQAFSVSCVRLIFRVSSLFSNVIGILGMPVALVLEAIFLNVELTGSKVMVMSMWFAMWGFVSYMYQNHLDGLKMKEKSGSDNEEVAQVAVVAERG